MFSLSAASRLISNDRERVIFVHTFDRVVEAVYARYVLRPIFGKKYSIKGWANTWKIVFFTQNDGLAQAIRNCSVGRTSKMSRGK